MLEKEDIKRRGLIYLCHHLPYNPKLIPRAKELRKNMTTAEKKIREVLLKSLPYRFISQRTIENYIVDFYCPELKLVIEIDGESHFTLEGKIYDNERDNILENYGIKILRISNTDIFNDFKAVCNIIKEHLPH